MSFLEDGKEFFRQLETPTAVCDDDTILHDLDETSDVTTRALLRVKAANRPYTAAVKSVSMLPKRSVKSATFATSKTVLVEFKVSGGSLESGSQNVLKLIFKNPRFDPFGGQSDSI